MVLLEGPTGWRFLMSEVHLYAGMGWDMSNLFEACWWNRFVDFKPSDVPKMAYLPTRKPYFHLVHA
jgi:hypothetical protein